MCASSSSGMPGAGVGDADLGAVVVGDSTSIEDLAGRGRELDRVADQVVEHLAEAVRVGDDGTRSGGIGPMVRRQAVGDARELEVVDGGRDHRPERDRDRARSSITPASARSTVSRSPTRREQPLGRAPDDLQVAALRVRHLLAGRPEHDLEVAEDRGQRRAQLVRGVVTKSRCRRAKVSTSWLCASRSALTRRSSAAVRRSSAVRSSTSRSARRAGVDLAVDERGEQPGEEQAEARGR